MARQRTGGMTAIGIMNIVFGAIGTLVCLLVAVAGGVLAAAGGAMEAEMGGEAEGLGTMAATGGAIIAGIGLLTGLAWLFLFVGGIGILKLANWGRKMCIGSAGMIVLLTAINFFMQGGVNIVSFAVLGYGITVIALCFSATWREACSGEGEWNAPMMGADDEQFRAAA